MGDHHGSHAWLKSRDSRDPWLAFMTRREPCEVNHPSASPAPQSPFGSRITALCGLLSQSACARGAVAVARRPDACAETGATGSRPDDPSVDAENQRRRFRQARLERGPDTRPVQEWLGHRDHNHHDLHLRATAQRPPSTQPSTRRESNNAERFHGRYAGYTAGRATLSASEFKVGLTRTPPGWLRRDRREQRARRHERGQATYTEAPLESLVNLIARSILLVYA